jgi:ATP-dependent exoDNAse (exonuclease V) alpha subunit
MICQNIDIDWKKPIVVTGEAGCGKSYTINSIVTYLLANDATVLVAAPTGFLASVFKAILPNNAKCETVHASFHFPVDTADIPPSINWQLSNFDVIIIDEISMIPPTIFEHILKTINVLLFRPVVLFAGDVEQQQPFCRQNGRIMQLQSAFDNSLFLSMSYTYKLLTQHRVGDSAYFAFLKTVRNWVPTQQVLDEIHEGHVISDDDVISNDTILKAFSIHSNNTILTFTKQAANRANEVIIDSIFAKENPLAFVQLDWNLPPINIYHGMRVVITQNRDKIAGIVNGQMAYVHTVHNNSVYLKLPDDKVVAVYPVTIKTDEKSQTLYPFCPAYATTICKAQGQTLDKIVVWFDIDAIPPGTAQRMLRCQE